MSINRNLEPTNEDTVQCLFFSTTRDSNIAQWEELCQQINNAIAVLSKDYIWHRDEFKVFLPLSDSTDSGEFVSYSGVYRVLES